MKLLAVLSALALVFSVVACGGSEKPPLTPDQDTPAMGDGGADMPSGDPAAAPADPSAAPAAPAAPAAN